MLLLVFVHVLAAGLARLVVCLLGLRLRGDGLLVDVLGGADADFLLLGIDELVKLGAEVPHDAGLVLVHALQDVVFRVAGAEHLVHAVDGGLQLKLATLVVVACASGLVDDVLVLFKLADGRGRRVAGLGVLLVVLLH